VEKFQVLMRKTVPYFSKAVAGQAGTWLRPGAQSVFFFRK
jgi:hypothetical protein